MGMNIIQQKIEGLVKIHLTPFFKSLGYKKGGRTFSFQWENNYRIVNIQSWKYNDQNSGKFTINLGIYLAKAQESTNFVAKAFPPKEYECQIRKRIGALIGAPHGDIWWNVLPTSDISELAKTIISHLNESAAPWLETMSIPEEAAEYYLRGDMKGMAALFYWVAGDLKRASELIDELLRTSDNEKLKKYWSEWAIRNRVKN